MTTKQVQSIKHRDVFCIEQLGANLSALTVRELKPRPIAAAGRASGVLELWRRLLDLIRDGISALHSRGGSAVQGNFCLPRGTWTGPRLGGTRR